MNYDNKMVYIVITPLMEMMSKENYTKMQPTIDCLFEQSINYFMVKSEFNPELAIKAAKELHDQLDFYFTPRVSFGTMIHIFNDVDFAKNNDATYIENCVKILIDEYKALCSYGLNTI